MIAVLIHTYLTCQNYRESLSILHSVESMISIERQLYLSPFKEVEKKFPQVKASE